MYNTVILAMYFVIGLVGGYIARRIGGPPTYNTWKTYGDFGVGTESGWQISILPEAPTSLPTVFWTWLFLWPFLIGICGAIVFARGVGRFNGFLEHRTPLSVDSVSEQQLLLEAQKEVNELTRES